MQDSRLNKIYNWRVIAGPFDVASSLVNSKRPELL